MTERDIMHDDSKDTVIEKEFKFGLKLKYSITPFNKIRHFYLFDIKGHYVYSHFCDNYNDFQTHYKNIINELEHINTFEDLIEIIYDNRYYNGIDYRATDFDKQHPKFYGIETHEYEGHKVQVFRRNYTWDDDACGTYRGIRYTKYWKKYFEERGM